MCSFIAGYVAIGFSDVAGRMGPADAYVGWVDGSGTAQVVDFTTNSRTVNGADPQQDSTQVSGSLANGALKLTFTRLLDTKVCLSTGRWKGVVSKASRNDCG